MTQEVKGLVLQHHGNEIDAIVLACTHFPLLREELAEAFGPEVALIDGAAGIAARITALTEGQAFERDGPDFAVTTGDLADFKRLRPAFAAAGIADLRRF